MYRLATKRTGKHRIEENVKVSFLRLTIRRALLLLYNFIVDVHIYKISFAIQSVSVVYEAIHEAAGFVL